MTKKKAGRRKSRPKPTEVPDCDCYKQQFDGFDVFWSQCRRNLNSVSVFQVAEVRFNAPINVNDLLAVMEYVHDMVGRRVTAYMLDGDMMLFYRHYTTGELLDDEIERAKQHVEVLENKRDSMSAEQAMKLAHAPPI